MSSVKFRLKNLISQYQYASWMVPSPELLELGTMFLTCWNISISGVWTTY